MRLFSDGSCEILGDHDEAIASTRWKLVKGEYYVVNGFGTFGGEIPLSEMYPNIKDIMLSLQLEQEIFS